MRVRKKKRPWWPIVILDIALIGLVLGGYWLLLQRPAVAAAVPVAIATPAPAAAPGETIQTTSPEVQPETTPEASLAPESPAEKFRDHFTDEVVITENSYQSPNISIVVSPMQTQTEDGGLLAYYVADVHLADMACLQTYLAKGEQHGHGSSDSPMNMATESQAILAMTGDYESLSFGGTIIRNGYLYRSENNGQDVCVFFRDGRLECYDAGTLVLEEIVAEGAVQAWTFGPTLVKNGELADNIYQRRYWGSKEPRAALGYYEPGHYCFVVADGRQAGYSDGADLEEMARIFQSLGCVTAYNMDGGGSAFMSLNGQRINRQSSDRQLGDIILIREVEDNT